MPDSKIASYYQKKYRVFQRRNERALAEQRVLFLESRFRATTRLLEPLKWEAIEAQLGDA